MACVLACTGWNACCLLGRVWVVYADEYPNQLSCYACITYVWHHMPTTIGQPYAR